MEHEEVLFTDAEEIQEAKIFRLDREVKADRLDKIVAQLLPEHSRARLQKWIEDGFITVNDKAAKVRQIVGAGDVISVLEQESEQSKAFTPEKVEDRKSVV